MVPGESKHIDTGLKIAIADPVKMLVQTPDSMYLKTKLAVKSHTFIREGNESAHKTETFKFILQNDEVPITYAIRAPGDKQTFMCGNKIKLITGEEIIPSQQLFAINSYLIRKDDPIANIIITKLGDE